MRPRSRIAPTGMTEHRAIIDIGSNTVRLVIYGGPPRAPVILYNEKVTARLGKGVAEGGQLSEKAMGAALAALGRYAALLRLRGIRTVETVATAAVRDAANGADFLGRVAMIGLQPRLLSGDEEAVTSAIGVAAAFPGARGVVADLGGGSLELVHVDAGRCEHGTSLPLGSLRLPRLRADGAASFSRRIHRIVADAACAFVPGQTLYLVGGNLRAFARFAMLQLDWPLDDAHGFELSTDAAQKVCRSILRGKLPPVVPGVSNSRVASLPDTAALLTVLLREIKPSRLVFSGWGLREGLVQASLPAAVRQQDPLVAGVSEFCEGLSGDAASAAMVAGWTAAANPSHGGNHENLRLAATMLALAVQQVEPNLRAAQACNWALRKRWTGVDATGRAMMAACALANAARSAPSAGLDRLASPQALHEATVWGAAIRLCRRFSGSSAEALANSELSIDGPQLVLSVREPFGALFTDVIDSDLRTLAGLLGCQPSYRLIPAADRLR